VTKVSKKPAERRDHVFGLHRTEFACLLSNKRGDVFRIHGCKVETMPRKSLRQKTINERQDYTDCSRRKAALLAQITPIIFKQRLPRSWDRFDRSLRRDALFAQKIEEPYQREYVFGAHSLFSHKVTPITPDYVLVQLFKAEMLLLKPAIEMPDMPKLDSAVDPGIALGCQSICE
jgi:hypothetical protein